MDLLVSHDDAGRREYARARLRQDVLEALHEALEGAGITQNELAKRLGVRKGAVSQVLNGKGNLRIDTLADYLSALGIQARVFCSEFSFIAEPVMKCNELHPVQEPNVAIVSGIKLYPSRAYQSYSLKPTGVGAGSPVYTEHPAEQDHVIMKEVKDDSRSTLKSTASLEYSFTVTKEPQIA